MAGSLLDADLSGATLENTIIERTHFGENSGLSEAEKQNLKQRGTTLTKLQEIASLLTLPPAAKKPSIKTIQ